EIAPTPGHSPPRPRWTSVVYVVSAAAGVATHLMVLIVVGVHVVVIAYLRRLDTRWRQRFLVIALLSALAYARTARYMIDENALHGRLFQRDLPRRVAEMALGEHWAAAVLVPVAIVGLTVLCGTRT